MKIDLASVPMALRRLRHPGRLKIGARLTICFIVIVVLMIASHLFSLWQFGEVRQQEERIHQLDAESHDVLTMHTTLLMLRNKLEEMASAEDSDRFMLQGSALKSQFLDDAARATGVLNATYVPLHHDPTMLSALEAIRSALPAQIDALDDLARLGDWPAVRLRLKNQVAPLSSLTSTVVEKVDLEVTRERQQAEETIRRRQREMLAIYIIAALSTLLLAGILGTLVTRSITRPLALLDRGAHSLALGNFDDKVAVEGEDELGVLARVFNDAAQRLRGLYGALKSSEERFRTVIAAAPVGIVVLDKNAGIQIFNPQFLKIAGIRAEEAVAMRLTDPRLAVLREDGTPCPIPERPSQRAFATGKPVLNVQLRNFHRPSREHRWVLTSAWPILGDDGGVEQAVVALTDITEQKRVEEELRSGRELLTQAQRAGHMGCFELDLRSNHVAWSPELTELFGLPHGNSTGRHEDWENLVVSEDLEQARASVAAALKTGESVAEYRIRRQCDQEIRWVESRGRAFFDESNQPVRLIGVTMDISDRKRAEAAIRQSEEEFHLIFDHAAIGMVLVDPAGRLIRANPAFRRIVGYTETELPNLTLETVTHPKDVDISRSRYADIVNGKRERYQIQKRYIRKDGEIRSARVTVSGLRSDKGELRYCVAMVEDITAQELAERNLLQMSERLLRIQEEEQRRIAREIHDSTSQEITALTLNLGALKSFSNALPESARRQVLESLALAKRVAREIRTFSYLLHPPMLGELGLWSALRMFVDEFNQRSGLQVRLEISEKIRETALHPSQEITLFRFIQEALANVHRHSGSRTAAVKAHFAEGMMVISVIDSGRGFSEAALKQVQNSSGFAGGVGIAGMYERIGYIGGRVEIHSDERETVVSAIAPVDLPIDSPTSLLTTGSLVSPATLAAKRP